MPSDPDDIDFDDPNGRLSNERLVREGGVFREPPRHEFHSEGTAGPLSADDYPDDLTEARHRPGTPDDLAYAYGTDATGAEDLWDLQQSLLEEDAEDAIVMPEGLTPEAAGRVFELMGDEVADAMPEGEKSSSATGEPTSSPEHGGFPERDR